MFMPLDADAREALKGMADGDGRTMINLAEDVFAAAGDKVKPLNREALIKLVQRRAPLYDKSREGHYNLISALHKSVRGSDPDAALYYFCRMLDGGEDRLFLARRLVRMAVEDIGLADPQALVVCNAAVTVGQLHAAARKRLSAFKVPTVWSLIRDADGIPLGATGKVDVSRLRHLLATPDLEK